MTEFGLALFTAAIRVSLLLVPAGLVIVLLARRHSRAAVLAGLWTLSLSMILWLVALLPDSVWKMPNARTVTAAVPSVTMTTNEMPAPSAGPRFSLHLPRLAESLPIAPNSATKAVPASAWNTLAIVVCVITAIATARLIAGWFAIWRLKRASQPIDDPALRRLVEELRHSLGCRRAIELRSCWLVTSAAMVGWWWPVILLAEQRHNWAADDLKAVLAHELAHARNGDFAANIFARVCLIVQGFHPLVLWLCRRLRAEQELAADALAASHVGGRDSYLQSLARLALQTKPAPAFCLARSFLNDGSTLLRRIAMLKRTSTDRVPTRWTVLTLRAALVVIAATASAVRGPGESPAHDKALPPLELSVLQKGAQGFWVVRPSAMAKMPGMDLVLARIQESLHNGFSTATAFLVPMQDIDQIVFYVTTDKGLFGSKSFSHDSIALIRMAHDYDWAAKLKAMPAPLKVEETRPGHFSVKALPLEVGVGEKHWSTPFNFHCRVLDGRTITFSDEKDLDSTPANVRWGCAAESTSACVVLGIDNRDGSLGKFLAGWGIYEDVVGLPPLIACANHAAITVDSAENAGGTLIVDCRSPADAVRAQEAINSFGEFARMASTTKLKDREKLSRQAQFGFELIGQLAERHPIEVRGTRLKCVGKSQLLFADVFRNAMAPLFDDPPEDKK
ncbi:MAG: M56 family metallopeptidase [Gemmataceae bacterium]